MCSAIRSTRSHRTMTCLGLTLLSLVTLTFALENNDIQGYLRNLDVVADAGDYMAEVDAKPSWGFEDTSAIAGKVFKYDLPKDVFHKGVEALKVTEKGRDLLPDWLEYDAASSQLRGVPGPAQVGKEIYLQVSPLDVDNGTTGGMDIFSVRVTDDDPHTDTTATPARDVKHDEALKQVKCAHGSSVTMATVIVDTEMSLMRPTDRVNLMEGMCHHLGLPTELVRLQAVGHKPMFDSMALVAGPGDIKQPMHSGTMIQWEVGCGNVFANHMPVLQQLENTAHDGQMGKSVGYNIIGWHVTNNKPQATKRVKRQVRVRPTSTPDILPPLPTRQPTESSRSETSDRNAPPSRTVPTLASPEFPEIKPTHSHSHHHHHTRGPKTHGRHHEHSTSVSKAVMATPTVLPVTPTRVVDTTSSAMPTGPGYIQPSEDQSHSPGISRSETVIEPSMTHAPIHPSSPTDILPTRTFRLPTRPTTEPIKPTTTSSESFTPPTKLPPMVPTDAPITRPPKTPPPVITDAPVPRVNNGGLVRIETTVGDILDYRIPANNFYDPKDGNTRHLNLTLMTIDNMDLRPSAWLRLDPNRQRLYGLPLAEHIGRNEYILAAINSRNRIINDPFEIFVKMRTGETRINHEMSMSLKLDYERFLLDVDQRIGVAKKLARAFGDKNMDNISVLKIRKGSVLYSWTNNSLAGQQDCPESALLAQTGVLVGKDGNLNEQFRKDMSPYAVSDVEVDFRGGCDYMPSVSTKPDDRDDDEELAVGGEVIKEPESKNEEDILVTTVAPAVVIAAMLLLGALIACILYRKRRKGKLSDEDQHTFLQKGIPIILPDELDDKPDPPTKPLIMPEEYPPQPPPQYPHSPSPSTPRSTHKEPLIETEDDHNSLLYRPPPPPMTGSLGHRNSRPRTPLSQRSPPQYMSPISP